MATTTKKSSKRAKTKTTKTKTTSTKAPTKKTEAKKVAPKASTKTKAVSASTSKRTTKAAAVSRLKSFKLAGVVTLRTLRGLHLVTVGVLVLLALAAGYLMDSTTQQLTIGHLAKDQLTSGTNTVLAPAVQAVYDIELRWLLVATLLLSAVLPLLYLTKLTNRYAAYLNETRMLPLRWIDFAVSGALIVETVALITGASDIPTLKLLGGLMVTAAIFGLIAERQNNAARTPVRSAYFASLFAGLLPLLFIAAYALATIVYATSEVAWHIYALHAVALFSYIGWMRNLRMHLRGANNLIVERNYLAVSLLTKAAFAIILIAGYYR